MTQTEDGANVTSLRCALRSELTRRSAFSPSLIARILMSRIRKRLGFVTLRSTRRSLGQVPFWHLQLSKYGFYVIFLRRLTTWKGNIRVLVGLQSFRSVSASDTSVYNVFFGMAVLRAQPVCNQSTCIRILCSWSAVLTIIHSIANEDLLFFFACCLKYILTISKQRVMSKPPPPPPQASNGLGERESFYSLSRPILLHEKE